MKRIRWVAAAVAAAMTVSLAACSSGGGEAASPAGPGKLTVWVMGDSSAHFDELVKPFTEETGTAVETVPIPWDSVDQKFTTAVASGNGPDVLQIGVSKLRTFADSGALLPLDDETLANHKNLASSNFLDGVAGDATAVDGKVVSLPWVSDTRVLFYRTDILSAAGVAGPPATWDELRADAKKLSGRGAGKFGFHVPQWDSALPVTMTRNFGGDIVGSDGKINFGTPEFEKAVDLYTGLYSDKSVPTNSDFDQVQGFVSGVTPMLVSGPYLAAAIKQAAPQLDGKWIVAPMPKAVTGTSLLAGSNLGIWKSTKNKDAALQLLDFLSRPDTQVKWFGLDGQLPTVKAALADPKLSSDPLAAVYSKQLMDSKLLPLVPNWDGETGKALLDALNAIALTGADRGQTLQKLFGATGNSSIN
ncbi:multiple sugar transport system substrate-binding protein [Kribbella sp. VKM Ac-2527]|uniref:Multiple sugar transport system substrate-binding protein n=1 Tax=Kribbella caucasensis TaxID=2512215 RepID=A0A4R6KLN8_9ACTN|nr:extracellular solute-binding protein [Kribbella sp. VKM Ac-2527]TDO51706.1 multiple sugar transport system substrate-binding protein [Kribbella sp. VKM Ac-2527]